MATHHGCTLAELIFGFALAVGMIPLTGTTSSDHMQDDLRVFDLVLQPDEISSIENCATG
jgi:aryl-alcohol dehydrogenase-like predicted oxidoreductase